MSKLRTPQPRYASYSTLGQLRDAGADHKDWYAMATGQIHAAATVLDCTPQRFADLLALFSPKVSVLRSVRFAVQWQRDGEFYHGCIRSVRASVRHYEDTGEIRGPKTSAFARAIMGDPNAIVLDTWMGRALNVPGKRFEVKTIREQCEHKINTLAGRSGWTPAQTQAAIWAGAVRRDRVNVPMFLIMPEIDGIPV